MSERRKPSLVLHVALASGEKLFADLFAASDFPRREGSAPGLYRMRIRTQGRKSAWHCPDGRKYAFLSFSQAAEALLATASGEIPPREEEPFLPEGSIVRVPAGRGPVRTRSIPFRGEDGLWRVFAGFSDSAPELVREIKVAEIAGFICRDMPPEGIPCPSKPEALARGWIREGEYPTRPGLEFTLADLRGHKPRRRGETAKYGRKRQEVEHGREEPGA